MENVDLGIAVKNAQQEVKQVASKILEQTNEEDAVAYVIKAMIDNKYQQPKPTET